MTLTDMHVFVGPSGGDTVVPDSWTVHGPVRAGDLRSLPSSTRRVLIVDGLFGSQLALTVSEVRSTILNGTEVWGAVSMGALRACECAPLGMKGIGIIAQMIASGEIVDDADLSVAVSPSGGGVTVPIVNVRLLCALLAQDGVSRSAITTVMSTARSIHFSERTYDLLLRDVRARLSVEDYRMIRTYFSSDLRREWDLKRMDYRRVISALGVGSPKSVQYPDCVPMSADVLLGA